MKEVNLKPYIDDTLKNLNVAIDRIESRNIDLSEFKTFLNSFNFQKNVVFIWWSQIIWSFSPFIHTFSSMSCKWKEFLFTLLDFSKEWLVVKDVLKLLEENERFLWANITMPYKIDIYNFLKIENKLDESAILVWAVNTLSKREWVIYWYNTDFEWILWPIKSKILDNNIKNIQTGYIIWWWWAAKAWIVALLILWISDIVILSRKENINLINHFQKIDVKNILKTKYWINNNINIRYKEYDVTNNDMISNIIDKKWILINTLPFWFKQQYPKKSILEWEVEKIKDNIELFFDVVYDINYWDTPIISEFKSFDIPVCDWIDMLIWQANIWFNLWTNWWNIDIDKIKKLIK